MKAVHPSYTFVASTKTITLTGLSIDQDQLLLIVNATRGVQYFNFADSSLRGTVTPGSNTTVVLTDASTTGHSNSDALVIYYDDQAAVQAVSGTVTANPGTGAFTVSGTVGLDANSLAALENITVTVGAAVTVANLPAVQQVLGTVTVGSLPAVMLRGSNGDQIDQEDAYIPVGGINSNPVGISGTVTASISDQFTADIVTNENLYGNNRRGIVIAAADDQNAAVALTTDGYANLNVRVNAGSVTIGSLPAISGTVTVGNSVTIGSCVTHGVTIANSSVTVGLASTTVTVSSLPNIAGTVTANINGTVPVSGTFWQATQPVSGTVTANFTNSVTIGAIPSSQTGQNLIGGSGVFSVLRIKDNAGTYGELQGSGTLTYNLPVYGTVTVSAMPSGTLTTRFGSVTTANTAQLTAAVTNSSRKFLLVQNIATSTVTIGIGFAPTTTQGIQLAAGAGLTFDAFCPTGGVWWLSSATGSNWSILES